MAQEVMLQVRIRRNSDSNCNRVNITQEALDRIKSPVLAEWVQEGERHMNDSRDRPNGNASGNGHGNGNGNGDGSIHNHRTSLRQLNIDINERRLPAGVNAGVLEKILRFLVDGDLEHFIHLDDISWKVQVDAIRNMRGIKASCPDPFRPLFPCLTDHQHHPVSHRSSAVSGTMTPADRSREVATRAATRRSYTMNEATYYWHGWEREEDSVACFYIGRAFGDDHLMHSVIGSALGQKWGDAVYRDLDPVGDLQDLHREHTELTFGVIKESLEWFLKKGERDKESIKYVKGMKSWFKSHKWCDFDTSWEKNCRRAHRFSSSIYSKQLLVKVQEHLELKPPSAATDSSSATGSTTGTMGNPRGAGRGFLSGTFESSAGSYCYMSRKDATDLLGEISASIRVREGGKCRDIKRKASEETSGWTTDFDTYQAEVWRRSRHSHR